MAKLSFNPTSGRPGGGFFAKPSTRLGWWAVAISASFVLMIITSALVTMLWPDSAWRLLIMPFFGVGTVLCGLAAGILALLAIVRQHERSWLVWLPLFVGANVVFLLLGEFLVPH